MLVRAIVRMLYAECMVKCVRTHGRLWLHARNGIVVTTLYFIFYSLYFIGCGHHLVVCSGRLRRRWTVSSGRRWGVQETSHPQRTQHRSCPTPWRYILWYIVIHSYTYSMPDSMEARGSLHLYYVIHTQICGDEGYDI